MESEIMTPELATESQASTSEISQKEKMKYKNNYFKEPPTPHHNRHRHYNSSPSA
jgi:hypothetical protein